MCTFTNRNNGVRMHTIYLWKQAWIKRRKSPAHVFVSVIHKTECFLQTSIFYGSISLFRDCETGDKTPESV